MRGWIRITAPTMVGLVQTRYAQRKETIERVFADAKEKHAMRYTHHRGLAAVTRWVRLKYAAMNLKKLAKWSWENSIFSKYIVLFNAYIANPRFLHGKNRGFFDRLEGQAVGLAPFVVLYKIFGLPFVF